jgi:hypothetical protein
MERNQVAPVGIRLEFFYRAKHWTPLIRVAQEDSRKPLREFSGNFR